MGFPTGFPTVSPVSGRQEATADAEQRWAEEALAEVQAAEDLAMEEVEAREAREAPAREARLSLDDQSIYQSIYHPYIQSIYQSNIII